MTITVEQVIATLEEVVAEKGEDYVYESPSPNVCRYGDNDGNPSCIAGHVIAKLEPDKFTEFKEFENINGSFGVSDFLNWDESFIEDMTPALDNWDSKAIVVLASAQRVQDTKVKTWGQALTAAKAAL